MQTFKLDSPFVRDLQYIYDLTLDWADTLRARTHTHTERLG